MVDANVDIGNLYNGATDGNEEVERNDDVKIFKENNIKTAANTSKIEMTLEGENKRNKEKIIKVNENTSQTEMARRGQTRKENKIKTERKTSKSVEEHNVRIERNDENIIKVKGNTSKSEKAHNVRTEINEENIIKAKGNASNSKKAHNVRTERNDENIMKTKRNTNKMQMGTKRNKKNAIKLEAESAKIEMASNVDNKTSALLTCCTCNFAAVTKAALAIHQNNHLSKLKLFACADCSFQTKFRSSIVRHERVVHGHTDILWCNQCGQSYFSKAELDAHTCIGLKKLICNMCNIETSTKQALMNHKKDFHGYVPRIFRCSDCAFQSECCKSIVRHQRTIHKHKDFFCCSKCGKMCFSRAELRVHECSSDEHVVCHVCGKTFSSPKCLKVHTNVHFGTNLYQCDNCSKAFPRKSDLLRHRDIMHNDKRTPFKCEHCSAMFLYKSSLYRHTRVSHVGTDHTETYQADLSPTMPSKSVGKFICSQCNKLFTYEAGLKSHLVVVHSENAMKDELDLNP